MHFIDQKMYEYWSRQKFEGYMSAKDFYVKSAEDAQNFTYYYYIGKHMVSWISTFRFYLEFPLYGDHVFY